MCIAPLKSMTHAIKAKNALSDYYIEAEIIKLEPNMTKKGCAYGVRFNCVNLSSAQEAFNKWSVKYTEIIRSI